MKPFIATKEKRLLMVSQASRGVLGAELLMGRRCHCCTTCTCSVFCMCCPRRARTLLPPCSPLALTSTRHAACPPCPPRPPPPLQVVVPLQCINNLAIIILDETTPAAESWFA